MVKNLQTIFVSALSVEIVIADSAAFKQEKGRIATRFDNFVMPRPDSNSQELVRALARPPLLPTTLHDGLLFEFDEAHQMDSSPRYIQKVYLCASLFQPFNSRSAAPGWCCSSGTRQNQLAPRAKPA